MFNCVARWRSLYLLARSARSDVRHGAAVFVKSDETLVLKNYACSLPVSSASPADRRRKHRLRGSRVESGYFVVARGGKNASASSSSARRRAIRCLITPLTAARATLIVRRWANCSARYARIA